MSERDLPQGTANDAPMSFNEGVSSIEALFQDPAPKPDTKAKDVEEHEVETDDTAEQDTDEGVEPDEEDGDEEVETDADEQGEVEDADDDGSEEPELKGGRFAPDTAKVTLDDGTVTTVGELRRNNLFQRDYTRKTQELAEERKQFFQERQVVEQTAQQIAQQRDFLLQAAQRLLPKAPDRSMMDSDPVGYMQAKAAYDEQMVAVNHLAQLQSHSQAQRQYEEQQQAVRLRQEEGQKLVSAMPELRDPARYQQFWAESVDVMSSYGFSADEIAAQNDHRIYLAMRDLAELRKIKAKAPKVQEEVRQKPKMIKGSRRMDPKAKISREAEARSERLRKTGSFEDGVAALMNLDL